MYDTKNVSCFGTCCGSGLGGRISKPILKPRVLAGLEGGRRGGRIRRQDEEGTWKRLVLTYGLLVGGLGLNSHVGLLAHLHRLDVVVGRHYDG